VNKKCNKCNEIKKIDLFSFRNKLKNQYKGKCKSCTKIERKSIAKDPNRIMTAESIDNWCKNNNIRRIGMYTAQQSSNVWLCLIHNKEFKTNFKNIKTRNSGCSVCHKEKLINTFENIGKKHTIEDISTYIKSERSGAILLSNTYSNQNSRIKVMCKNKHIFDRVGFNSLKVSWCSKCKPSTENKCREIFETKFNKKFPSVRPNFLRNPKTGRNLELDGYCEELKLAFEYDGRMHYEEWSKKTRTDDQIKKHGSLQLRQECDLFKTKTCRDLGITLIRIPYWENTNLENYIKLSLGDKRESL